jgi:predicted ATPase
MIARARALLDAVRAKGRAVVVVEDAHWADPGTLDVVRLLARLARRRANGDGGLEALRALKRRLSDVVYRALRTDATIELRPAA